MRLLSRGWTSQLQTQAPAGAGQADDTDKDNKCRDGLGVLCQVPISSHQAAMLAGAQGFCFFSREARNSTFLCVIFTILNL